jgi:three-Cys-motif partner protein
LTRARTAFFDRFKSHTQQKHDVLEAYMAAWAMILLQDFPRVWFVDGFAGKGKDEDGRHGSPLIACEVAESVRSAFALQGKNRKLRVVAIESSTRRAKALRANLATYVDSGVAEVIRGDVWETIEGVLKRSDEEPLLLFVDPFGLKGLSAKDLAAVL